MRMLRGKGHDKKEGDKEMEEGKEYKISGKITNKEYTHAAGLGWSKPVTAYSITKLDGTVYRAGFIGHRVSPRLGDIVEMYLEKDNIIMKEIKDDIHKKREDGFIEIINQEVQWEAIKRYKIIDISDITIFGLPFY